MASPQSGESFFISGLVEPRFNVSVHRFFAEPFIQNAIISPLRTDNAQWMACRALGDAEK
jgi:hypothetical protein